MKILHQLLILYRNKPVLHFSFRKGDVRWNARCKMDPWLTAVTWSLSCRYKLRRIKSSNIISMHLYVTVMLYRVVAYYIPSHREILHIVSPCSASQYRLIHKVEQNGPNDTFRHGFHGCFRSRSALCSITDKQFERKVHSRIVQMGLSLFCIILLVSWHVVILCIEDIYFVRVPGSLQEIKTHNCNINHNELLFFSLFQNEFCYLDWFIQHLL